MSRRLSDRPLENDVTRLFAPLRGWLTRTGAWVGRQVGGHVGIFGNGPLTSAFLEATDTTNTPFMSVGLDPATADSQWLRIGYETEPGIRLQDVAGHALKQVRIDPECLSGVTAAGLAPSTLALLLCATGSGAPTGTGTVGQMYLDLVSATLWTYTATGWVAAFSRGQIGGHEHQEDAGGGKLDHGLALSAASLADDDHPLYLQKSAVVATQIGQVRFSIDGAAFSAQLPVTDVGGWLVEENSGALIVIDTP